MLAYTADNGVEVYADGTRVGSNLEWGTPITNYISFKTAILAFELRNLGGPYGLLVSMSNGVVSNADGD